MKTEQKTIRFDADITQLRYVSMVDVRNSVEAENNFDYNERAFIQIENNQNYSGRQLNQGMRR